MMATRLRHKEVEGLFNNLSQDHRHRPWKRGEPDPESSHTNVNGTADPNAPVPANKTTGPAAASAPPVEDQSARVPPRGGTQKNPPAGADSDQPTNSKKNPQNPNLFRFSKPKPDSNPNGTRNGAGYWVPVE